MHFQHRADAIIIFVSYRSQIYGGTDVAFNVVFCPFKNSGGTTSKLKYAIPHVFTAIFNTTIHKMFTMNPAAA